MDLLVRPQPANNFEPPVESKVLLQTGQKKGIRLISYESLMAYLRKLPTTAYHRKLEGPAPVVEITKQTLKRSAVVR